VHLGRLQIRRCGEECFCDAPHVSRIELNYF
jgi:hypothetical protein